MTNYAALERIRDASPFHAEMLELVLKHYPDAFRTEAHDYFKATNAMACIMGALLSCVFTQRNEATGVHASRLMFKKIMDEMSGIHSATLDALRKNIDPNKELN